MQGLTAAATEEINKGTGIKVASQKRLDLKGVFNGSV
jgi:hypothetical protein